MKRGYLFSLTGLVIVLLAVSYPAMAQSDLHEPSRAFSGLLELIKNNASQWTSRLQGYAQFLFWSLVAIDIVLIFGPLALRNADTGEILGELFRFVMTIGLFSSLLIYSASWSEAIINSFRQAGATAAGVGMQLTPGDMFSLGVELAYTVSDVGTGFDPGLAVAIAVSAIIILLCFTFIAAFMAYTLAQSYVLIYAGVLFMGFGGSKYTREYAISPLRYAVAAGAKLFALTLIVGIVMATARDWQAHYQHDNTSMFTLVSLAAFCALLSKAVPEFLEGMITGASTGGGGAIGGMAAAGMAFGAGAMAMIQASASGGALGGVGKSVSDLLKSSGIGSGGSSMNMNSGGSSRGSSSGPSPRVGGGSGLGPAPGPAPKASGPTSSASSGATSAASGGNAPKASSVSTMAHAAAEMGLRTVGTATAVAMPGADSAATLSAGPPPTPPDFGESELSDTPENVIRAASDEVQPESRPVDTMSSLQEALNNRGKAS